MPTPFAQMIEYFGEKIGASPPAADVEGGEVDLRLDEWTIEIRKGKEEGSLDMRMLLGFLLQPPSEAQLKELVSSNFLGVNTGGCTFMLDEPGGVLTLRHSVTSGTSSQECWEWLHRLVAIGREWNKNLTQWEDFVPLKGD